MKNIPESVQIKYSITNIKDWDVYQIAIRSILTWVDLNLFLLTR